MSTLIDVEGVRLEIATIGAISKENHTLVFLHDGIGSVRLWRDFPAKVAAATGLPALIYSRRGYGESDPYPGPRRVDYMHGEARDVLPKLLAATGIARPILIGHSDGASIALIYAGSRSGPAEALVLLAPHVFVEDLTIAGIEHARDDYRGGDVARRLARYHRDPDHSFWGWNDIWLNPKFRAWNIEEFLPAITAPILIVQGAQDEYGTVAQCEAIRRATAGPCQVTLLPDCRHSPHRDQPAATFDAVQRFISPLQAAGTPR
jgi:pimeloyl-ACP methyl ester carboxylesterase